MLNRLAVLCLMAVGALDACFRTMTPSTVTTTAAPITCTLRLKNLHFLSCSQPTSPTLITLTPGQTTFLTCSQSAASLADDCVVHIQTIDTNGNFISQCKEAAISCSSQDGLAGQTQPNIPFVCEADGSVTYNGATITDIFCESI